MQPATNLRALPRSLTSIQAGRGIAAVLVVLFHTSRAIFQNAKYWDKVPFGGIFDFGNDGVMFFFVLSGFIMYHAHLQDLGRPGRLQNYIVKRIRRIYPIYWVVLLLVLPAYLLVKNFGVGYETRPDVILGSFFLVHLQTPYQVISVSWTLFHEVLFYALFAAVIWRPAIGAVVLCLWFAASTQTADAVDVGRLLPFYFSYLHLLFALGIAARMFLARARVPLPWAAMAAGIALMLLIGADQVYWHGLNEVADTLLFGLGSTVALLGAVELQASGALRVPHWMIVVGDGSYAIYLVHFFTLSVLAKLAWASGLARYVPVVPAFMLMALAATISGLVLHLAVERPMLAWLGRRPASNRVAQVRTA